MTLPKQPTLICDTRKDTCRWFKNVPASATCHNEQFKGPAGGWFEYRGKCGRHTDIMMRFRSRYDGSYLWYCPFCVLREWGTTRRYYDNPLVLQALRESGCKQQW